jgi:hypothetical protein
LVRFGGAPPTDGSREETFRLAESFAERLGRYKMEEGAADSLDGLLRGAITRKSAETASGTTRKEYLKIFYLNADREKVSV